MTIDLSNLPTSKLTPPREYAAQLIPHTTSVHNVEIIKKIQQEAFQTGVRFGKFGLP